MPNAPKKTSVAKPLIEKAIEEVAPALEKEIPQGDRERVEFPEWVTLSIQQWGKDSRKALLDALNKLHPKYVHTYQKSDVSSWELQAKRQEVVKDENGVVIHHMGDPVVRQDAEAWMNQRKLEQRMSLESVKAVVENPRLAYRRDPVKVRNGQED